MPSSRAGWFLCYAIFDEGRVSEQDGSYAMLSLMKGWLANRMVLMLCHL